ncbi:MAG: hypothetical protein QNL91_14575 [Candidatus Krumholzibacteria bacterium]|nr:hypothetical protein [Candidatus Krumholzibacteria bacterium]
MRHFSVKTPNILILLTFLGLLATGCSNDNGTAPEVPGDGGGGGTGGEEEILVPKTLKVRKISVSAFGAKNGGNWDATLSVSGRRPDLYVTLRTGSSTSAPIYVSNVVDDAFDSAPYDFTASSAGTGLPKTVTANRSLYIRLMDEDIGADDAIGSLSFRPLTYYNNDNSTGFYKVFFGSNGTKVSVTGTWGY